jgi:hypothetical protein
MPFRVGTTPTRISLDLCRFAEILGAIRLAPAGETVESWVGGDPGNLVVHPVAAQHAQVPVMICSAGAFLLISHHSTTFHLCISASKSVPILAENVLKENA